MLLIPERRERTCPRAVKRARHNSYRVKKPDEPASIRHNRPATIKTPQTQTPSSMINLGYVALLRQERGEESYVGSDSFDVLLCER